MEKLRHDGRNIKMLRDLFGKTQETLADSLGISQQAYSKLEYRDEVEDDKLEVLAKIYNISVEAIKNFDPEAAVNIISNTFTDFKDNSAAINTNCTLHFNPIDKWMEALKKNEDLYERMLQTEREKVALLEKMLNSKS